MLALTLDGSKRFPDPERLLRFIRALTGKTQRSASALLDQVVVGANAAIAKAGVYVSKHKDAGAFVERLVASIRRGRDRLAPKRKDGGASRT